MNNDPAKTIAPREIALVCHPSTPGDAVRRIGVEVQRSGDTVVQFRYRLTGDIAALTVPAAGTPRRGHDLWKHTCFEAFIAADDSGHYYELNFSPSCEWAVYRLSAYRQGLTPVDVAQPAEIAVERQHGQLSLSAEIDLSPLPDLAAARELRLALSTVVEDQQQRVSFWALAHPASAPDFHHPDSFALSLPARPMQNARQGR